MFLVLVIMKMKMTFTAQLMCLSSLHNLLNVNYGRGKALYSRYQLGNNGVVTLQNGILTNSGINSPV